MEQLYAVLPSLMLPWYETHKRSLPWRLDRDPYHIWLSEVMLQQTRVEAVKEYYQRFLKQIPTIHALAKADPELLNKLWEGLGYYSRVRNLQKAACQIQSLHQGQFPREPAAIRALAGIGDYTAGAIGSICFELPMPAVDGNVLRVCSRFAADYTPIDSPQRKKQLTAALSAVYPTGHCGDFTQALMELGATVCIPNGTPHCDACPLRHICRAHVLEIQSELPVKSEKKQRRQETMTVFLLYCSGKIAISKRPANGLLAGLWEYPHVEGALDASDVLAQAECWGVSPEELLLSSRKKHVFTHIQWNMCGWYLRCAHLSPNFTWVTEEELTDSYALPTAFRQFNFPLSRLSDADFMPFHDFEVLL